MSRLQQQIQAEIDRSADEDQRWCGRLRMAAYLARSGRLQAGAAEVELARVAYRARVVPSVLANINLAEAQVAFFGGRPDLAIDKARRSQLIASGSRGGSETFAAAAAWEAHFHQNLSQWDELQAAARACLSKVISDQSEVLARLGLVFANAWLENGSIDQSEVWYRAARSQAARCGDDSLIAALIFNRAVLRLFSLRILEVTGAAVQWQECAIALEEASARNFAAYSGVNSMPALLEVLRGQLLASRGQFDQAVEVLSTPAAEANWPHVDTMTLADLAYCNAMLGRLADAEAAALAVSGRVATVRDPGDVAQIAHRLALCWQLIGNRDMALEYESMRATALVANEDLRKRGRSMLMRFEDDCRDQIVALELRAV